MKNHSDKFCSLWRLSETCRRPDPPQLQYHRNLQVRWTIRANPTPNREKIIPRTNASWFFARGRYYAAPFILLWLILFKESPISPPDSSIYRYKRFSKIHRIINIIEDILVAVDRSPTINISYEIRLYLTDRIVFCYFAFNIHTVFLFLCIYTYLKSKWFSFISLYKKQIQCYELFKVRLLF